jgi:hypothetical protein
MEPKEKLVQLRQFQPLMSVPVPASSPDLSPNDFFLFGVLKERISGTSDSPPDERISATSELITSLHTNQLVSIYKNWMERLNWVIKHRGTLPQAGIIVSF